MNWNIFIKGMNDGTKGTASYAIFTHGENDPVLTGTTEYDPSFELRGMTFGADHFNMELLAAYCAVVRTRRMDGYTDDDCVTVFTNDRSVASWLNGKTKPDTRASLIAMVDEAKEGMMLVGTWIPKKEQIWGNVLVNILAESKLMGEEVDAYTTHEVLMANSETYRTLSYKLNLTPVV